MFYKILVLTLFFFSALNHIKATDCVFISSGFYPNYAKYGVNLPTCGQTYVAEIMNISRQSNCFAKSAGNYTIVKRSEDYRIFKSEQVSSRIFKGSQAKKGESPWTVRIYIITKVPKFGKYYRDKPLSHSKGSSSQEKEEKRYYCTGSLITFRWVLTSALCMQGAVHLEVEDSTGNRKQTVPKSNIFNHPVYNGSGYDYYQSIDDIKHDIALIKLDQEFNQVEEEDNYYLNTICLPNDALQTDEREIATLSGFGHINDKGSWPKYLNIAEIRIKPGELCNNRMLLCAEFNGDDPRPCQGDNGGPLYQLSNEPIPRAVQIGIYIRGGYRGVGSCNSGHARKLFQPPMRFIDWILKTIKDNN